MISLLRHSMGAMLDLPAQLGLMLFSALTQGSVQEFIDGRRGNTFGCIGLVHLTQRDCQTLQIRLDGR